MSASKRGSKKLAASTNVRVSSHESLHELPKTKNSQATLDSFLSKDPRVEVETRKGGLSATIDLFQLGYDSDSSFVSNPEVSTRFGSVYINNVRRSSRNSQSSASPPLKTRTISLPSFDYDESPPRAVKRSKRAPVKAINLPPIEDSPPLSSSLRSSGSSLYGSTSSVNNSLSCEAPVHKATESDSSAGTVILSDEESPREVTSQEPRMQVVSAKLDKNVGDRDGTQGSLPMDFTLENEDDLVAAENDKQKRRNIIQRTELMQAEELLRRNSVEVNEDDFNRRYEESLAFLAKKEAYEQKKLTIDRARNEGLGSSSMLPDTSKATVLPPPRSCEEEAPYERETLPDNSLTIEQLSREVFRLQEASADTYFNLKAAARDTMNIARSTENSTNDLLENQFYIHGHGCIMADGMDHIVMVCMNMIQSISLPQYLKHTGRQENLHFEWSYAEPSYHDKGKRVFWRAAEKQLGVPVLVYCLNPGLPKFMTKEAPAQLNGLKKQGRIGPNAAFTRVWGPQTQQMQRFTRATVSKLNEVLRATDYHERFPELEQYKAAYIAGPRNADISLALTAPDANGPKTCVILYDYICLDARTNSCRPVTKKGVAVPQPANMAGSVGSVKKRRFAPDAFGVRDIELKETYEDYDVETKPSVDEQKLLVVTAVEEQKNLVRSEAILNVGSRNAGRLQPSRTTQQEPRRYTEPNEYPQRGRPSNRGRGRNRRAMESFRNAPPTAPSPLYNGKEYGNEREERRTVTLPTPPPTNYSDNTSNNDYERHGRYDGPPDDTDSRTWDNDYHSSQSDWSDNNRRRGGQFRGPRGNKRRNGGGWRGRTSRGLTRNPVHMERGPTDNSQTWEQRRDYSDKFNRHMSNY